MSERPSCKLVFDVGKGPVHFEVNKPRAIIGRSPICDVIIPAASVSRRHAAIECDGETWTIVDLGSLNKVRVNGIPTDRRRLEDEDVITLGRLDVTFRLRGSTGKTRIVVDETSTGGGGATTVFRMSQFQPLGMGLGGRAAAASAGEVGPAAAGASAVEGAVEAPADEIAGVGQVIELVGNAARAFFSSENLEQLLERFIELAFETLPASRGAICFYDEHTGEITPTAARTSKEHDDGELVISRTIADQVLKNDESVLVENVGERIDLAKAGSLSQGAPRSVICAPLFRDGETKGLIYMDNQHPQPPFTDQDLKVLTTLGLMVAVGVQQAKLREIISRERRRRARLERYHSPGVIDRVLLRDTTAGAELVAEEREVTVLFCDLHRFTRISEEMSATAVAELLNQVFDRLAEIIFRFDGTLDKFTGDGLMALFGTVFDEQAHATRAVSAAVAMREAVTELDEALRDELELPLPLVMRFGINTGTAVVGDIGSFNRRDFTAIGDAVNVASRLEELVANPGQIVIGERTHELIGSEFDSEALGEVTVEGRDEPVRPYILVETGDEVTTAEADAVEAPAEKGS